MMRTHTHNTAFSLFELVVSLALLVLLFGSLLTIFNAGIGIQKSQDYGLTPFEEARNIFRAVEDDIHSIVPSKQNDGSASELFQGQSDTMRFVSIDRISNDSIGIQYYYNAATDAIERRSTTTTSDTLPSSFTVTDIIGNNVTSCAITYYDGQFSGLQLTNPATQWTGSVLPLDAPSEMPMAIQISLTIADTKTDREETLSRLFMVRNR